MSDTPKYNAMCKAVDDLHRNLERDGEAIAEGADTD
jgi:hypothetical protein